MAKKIKPSLKVVELFAGVGGFRLGLEGPKNRPLDGYNVVWSNQWEPMTKQQHASDVYVEHWGNENHSNEDISKVSSSSIPKHDLLVGGFPCQDYSVARTLKQAHGLIGKKGVLWWEIYRIIKDKKNNSPKYLLLENVDRLLKSPAKQRGRDFAIMLTSLADLGYIVEWRIINAADYGMPQRRRRVFIIGYKKGTPIYKAIKKLDNPADWILNDGTLANSFPVKESRHDKPVHEDFFTLDGDLQNISDSFKGDGNKSPFENTGIMLDKKVYSVKTSPIESKKDRLGRILIDEKKVPKEFFINDKDLEKWKYLKGAKKEYRKSSSGHEYFYTEGPMVFPDALDGPSRTIVTGEGGATPSRFKHVVKTKSGRLRRLTPLELERLNMFPDDHTKNAPDARRAFFMGNALVVGVVERIGRGLLDQISSHSK